VGTCSYEEDLSRRVGSVQRLIIHAKLEIDVVVGSNPVDVMVLTAFLCEP
jgi:hypothetical protein